MLQSSGYLNSFIIFTTLKACEPLQEMSTYLLCSCSLCVPSVEPIWLTCGSQSVFVRLWCNKCTKCSASCFLSLLSVSSSPLSKPWLYLASVCSSPVADQFTRQQWHHCSDRSTGARCRSNDSSYASREGKLSRPVVCLWWTRLTVSAVWNLSVFTCSLFLFITYSSSRRRLCEFVICAFCQKGMFELPAFCIFEVIFFLRLHR